MAALDRDYTMVMGVVVVYAGLVIAAQLHRRHALRRA